MSYRKQINEHDFWENICLKHRDDFAALGACGNLNQEQFYQYCRNGLFPNIKPIDELTTEQFSRLLQIVNHWHPDWQTELMAFWAEKLKRLK